MRSGRLPLNTPFLTLRHAGTDSGRVGQVQAPDYIRHRTYLVSIPGMFGNMRKISSAFTLLTLNGTSDSMMVVAHARTMWVTSPSSFVVFIRQVDPVP